MSQPLIKSCFSLVRQGRARILVDPHFYDWLKRLGIENVEGIIDKSQIDPDRGGRRDLRVFIPQGEEDRRLIIRSYGRGGLLRRLLGNRFLFGSRPFREMVITEAIRRRGIPTMKVVAALRRTTWGPFYQGELISEEIPEARDVVSVFSSFGEAPTKKESALRREIPRQAGRAIRFMHDQGVYHGDLNLKNLLVQTANPNRPQVYVIDLDGSRIAERLSTKRKMRNIFRLNRSVEKWKAQGLRIRYGDRARFFRAYAQGDKTVILSMRRYLRGYPFRTLWYRMGWSVDRILNPSNP